VKLPAGEAAIVDRLKLVDYCLNPEHPRGKHKARVFATAGFTSESADQLRALLLAAAAAEDAQPTASDRYGDRYVVDSDMIGPNGATAVVRSLWIICRGETAPRLTSCFVK
jgi:hypothetical protein